MINSTGLIKVGDIYFNPTQVQKIEKCNDNSALVYMDNKYNSSNDPYGLNRTVKCSAEKFANALIEAQNTGKIVDVVA